MTANGDCSHETKRCLLLGRKALTNLDSILKSRDITLPTKFPSSQDYGFSSSQVWMWELDHRKSWALKTWCFWTVVLEKTLKSPFDSKEVKPVNPKGSQSRIFIGKTYAEAEVSILWSPDVKSWHIRKDIDSRKNWRQEEKGLTDNEIVGWHHQLNRHEFEQAYGDGEDREAWHAAVHGVTKSWTRQSDWTTATAVITGLEPRTSRCTSWI